MLGMFWHKEYGFLLLPVIQQTKKGETTSSINFMGRWKYARPVPFNGGGEDKKSSGGEQVNPQEKVNKIVLEADIGQKDILWEVPFCETQEEAVALMENCCALLYDYTPQISEIPLARAILENPFYDGQIEIIKMMRTASLNSTGVTWVRVNSEAEAQTMRDQFRIYDQMLLNGTRYLCISSTTELQEGSTKSTAQMQEFWASWNSLENLRQSCIGLENDGIVQKTQYQNQMQTQLDNIGNNPVMLDAWLQRVKFCTIVNALWGLNIGVEVAGMSQGMNEGEETESADNGTEGGDNGTES